jgi:hypothetical protein
MFVPDGREEAVQLIQCKRLRPGLPAAFGSLKSYMYTANNRTVNNGLLFYLHDEALNYKHH